MRENDSIDTYSWWLYRMSIKGEEAIGYVRVSTVRQVSLEGFNSIQSQNEDVKTMLKRGIILRSRNIVIDDGTSLGGSYSIMGKTECSEIIEISRIWKAIMLSLQALDRYVQILNELSCANT